MDDMTIIYQNGNINVLNIAGVKGDGDNDDTDGLQSAFDTQASIIYFPRPKQKYRISKTLKIYSHQTLIVDKNAVIHLNDRAFAHMITNSDHVNGNTGITVTGGIWDGNNNAQTCDYHENIVPENGVYNPKQYLGVVMQFNNIKDLTLHDITIKDPESFGIQVGNLQRFLIENITFDYNMRKHNMDGVHIHGNSHQGVVRNLKGATNDDLLALNADDGWMFEMSRGTITDIEVDGIFAENGYTAVRLLSAGSEIKRIRLSNIFGSYRYNVVSFTHHNVHPGEASVFEDIVIDGVFCSKPIELKTAECFEYGESPAPYPLIWMASGTIVRTIHINNMIRNERLPNSAAGTITIDQGASVGYLDLSNATLVNNTDSEMHLVLNEGELNALNLSNIFCKAENGTPRGFVLAGNGTIKNRNTSNVIIDNFEGIEQVLD